MQPRELEILRHPPLRGGTPRSRWEAARASEVGILAQIVKASHGAPTVGAAFYAGYQGALAMLLGEGGPGALLLTESTGQTPRALRTTVDQGCVQGSKSHAMMDVDRWWVVAVAGRVDPVDLRLVEVRSGEGTRTLRPQPWLLDVPHCELVFDGAPGVERLRGQQVWERIVRPFRALEDGAVLLALCVAMASSVDDQEPMLALAAGLLAVLQEDPEHPLTTRRLAGLRHLFLAADPRPTGPLAESWAVDQRLLRLAGSVRDRRTSQAREAWSIR